MAASKAILIGVDGMDPRITEEMMDQGELPTFSRFRRDGQYERLATLNPPQSPVVWASIATGCNPGEHGIFDFIHRDPSNYLPYLSLLRLEKMKYVNPLKMPTLWDRLSKAGIPSTVLKWPVAFPPTTIKGRVLAGLGVPDIKGMLGIYTYYTTNMAFGSSDTKGRIVKVNIQNNHIKTDIRGPYIPSLTGRKEATVQLEIIIKRQRIACKVGNITFNITERTWSDWQPVTFDIGYFRKVTGNCRFFLKSIQPEFALYLSPVNVAYDSAEFPISTPASFAHELYDSIGHFSTLGIAEDTNALNDGALDDAEFIKQCEDVMNERELIFEHELSRFTEGLLSCVFDTTDRVQHMFWRAMDRRHPLHTDFLDHQYRNVIGGFYRRMDSIIGHILKRVSSDTLLLVCSDHGFRSFTREVHLNRWLVQNGFMSLNKGATGCDGLFDGVNWGKTKAYALGFTSIYFNIRGREAQGILDSYQVQFEKKDLRDRLHSYKDKGKQVIREVYDSKDLYFGKQVTGAPDMVVGYQDQYRGSGLTAIGGIPESVVVTDNIKKWSGDHCCDAFYVPGVLFCNQPDQFKSICLECISETLLNYLTKNRLLR